MGRWRRSRRRGWSDSLFPGPVEAAGRVTLEVRRHELVAGRANRIGDALALFDQTPDVSRVDLDARHVAVMSHADLPEAQRLERILRRLDLPQRPDGHRAAVRDSRGKAREGRLVPVGQAEGTCGGSNLGLRHARLQQREPDGAAPGRGMAGPWVA